jgi:hypothetical protein
MLMRFEANGSIDTTFANEGIFLQRTGNYSGLYGMELQPDGKIVTAGYTNVKSSDDFLLMRNDAGSCINPALIMYLLN